MDADLLKAAADILDHFAFAKSALLLFLFLLTVTIFNADKIAVLLETVLKIMRRKS